MDPIRILLAIDSPSARAQVRAGLSTEPAIEIVGEAVDGAQTLRLVHTTMPQVVLIDPFMRGGGGMMAVLHIAEQLPHVTMLVLTGDQDAWLTKELHRLGVCCIRDLKADGQPMSEIIRGLAQSRGRAPTAQPE